MKGSYNHRNSGVCDMIMNCDAADEDKARWLAKRYEGICGTDLGAIAGVSPWKDAFDVWKEKTEAREIGYDAAAAKAVAEENLAPMSPEDNARKERMRWGKLLEDVIRKEFTERTGKRISRIGMIRNKEHPWMLADVDGAVVGENAIVEIKTAMSFKRKEWDGDNIPDTYYLQIMHYLITGGFDRCYVICLIGGNELLIKTVERNEDDIKKIIELEDKFWNENVLQKKIPPLGTLGSPDATSAGLRRGKKDEVYNWKVLNKEATDIAKNLIQLEESKKELEEKIKEHKKYLGELLENGEKAGDGSSPEKSTVTISKDYRSTTSVPIAKLREWYPEIVEKFGTKTEYSMIRVKENK